MDLNSRAGVTQLLISYSQDVDLIALDEALIELAKVDQRKSRIVEMKFFGGMTGDEIAEVLQISPTTVDRDWTLARAWLFRALEGNL